MFSVLRKIILGWLYKGESPNLYIPSFVELQDDIFVNGVTRLLFVDEENWSEDRWGEYDRKSISHKSGLVLEVSRYKVEITHRNTVKPESYSGFSYTQIKLSSAQQQRLYDAYTRWHIERSLRMSKIADEAFDNALLDEGRDKLANENQAFVAKLPKGRGRRARA